MAAAEFHIGIALTNFYKLHLPDTTAIPKFEENQCRKLRAAMGPRPDTA